MLCKTMLNEIKIRSIINACDKVKKLVGLTRIQYAAKARKEMTKDFKVMQIFFLVTLFMQVFLSIFYYKSKVRNTIKISSGTNFNYLRRLYY